jgi:hypothetical protein
MVLAGNISGQATLEANSESCRGTLGVSVNGRAERVPHDPHLKSRARMGGISAPESNGERAPILAWEVTYIVHVFCFRLM